MREDAIRFAMTILASATDWQEGEHALIEHPRFGPWLIEGGDAAGDAQSIVRAAEDRLGDALAY